MSPLLPSPFALASIAGLALATFPTLCEAATFADADDYNTFVLGDMTSTYVDTEGRVAIGGNADLTGYGVGSKFSTVPTTAGNALVVGGNLAYHSGEVHYGSLVYGGTLSGSPSVPNGTISQGNPIDFASTREYLLGASSYWASLAANGSTVAQYGGITLTGTDPSLNVFSLSGLALASSSSLNINAPAGSTVLVNIDGSSNSFQYMGVNLASGGTDRQHVVYNFFESTSLAINGISVQGTVLAPQAALTFGNGNIEGHVMVDSFIGSGEAHHYPFLGSLPAMTVPEPAAATGLASLLILSCASRRRRD